MRPAVRRRWALPALLATACSLPAASDYAKPATDAGTPAAAIPPTGSPDAAAPAAADASLEAGPPAFTCPTGALFCDDFERLPIGVQWDDTDEEAGGAVSALTLPDGTHALTSHTPARTDGTVPVRAYLATQVTKQAYAALTVSLDLQIAKLTDVGIVDLDFVRYQTPFYRVGLRVADYDEGFFLHDYGDPINGGAIAGQDNPITKMVAGQWTHVVFSISYGDGHTAHARLSFDGNVVYDGGIDAGKYGNQPSFVEAGIVTTENDAVSDETFNVDHLTVTSP